MIAEHRLAVARVIIRLLFLKIAFLLVEPLFIVFCCFSSSRILYGRLHLSKENLTSAVFTNLAGCSDDELALLLSLLVESFFSALGIIGREHDDLPFAEIKAIAKPNWSRLQA